MKDECGGENYTAGESHPLQILHEYSNTRLASRHCVKFADGFIQSEDLLLAAEIKSLHIKNTQVSKKKASKIRTRRLLTCEFFVHARSNVVTAISSSISSQ